MTEEEKKRQETIGWINKKLLFVLYGVDHQTYDGSASGKPTSIRYPSTYPYTVVNRGSSRKVKGYTVDYHATLHWNVYLNTSDIQKLGPNDIVVTRRYVGLNCGMWSCQDIFRDTRSSELDAVVEGERHGNAGKDTMLLRMRIRLVSSYWSGLIARE
ncbi:hypothetical protein ARMSODRAFT_978707 [Armillaria solidipes]|uniref:Uncharacterized protein n=1 Tax=Armillaria solidipes TaxID=1076256 RepID=A0A2H3BDA7_9AGAR|nr:hypothetical protein ARMSODRAFT_978707 [Armillaria solidipes]